MRAFLALFCRVCPLCILARAFPRSVFAAIERKLGRFCPFCRARRALERGRQNPPPE